MFRTACAVVPLPANESRTTGEHPAALEMKPVVEHGTREIVVRLDPALSDSYLFVMATQMIQEFSGIWVPPLSR